METLHLQKEKERLLEGRLHQLAEIHKNARFLITFLLIHDESETGETDNSELELNESKLSFFITVCFILKGWNNS